MTAAMPEANGRNALTGKVLVPPAALPGAPSVARPGPGADLPQALLHPGDAIGMRPGQVPRLAEVRGEVVELRDGGVSELGWPREGYHRRR